MEELMEKLLEIAEGFAGTDPRLKIMLSMVKSLGIDGFFERVEQNAGCVGGTLRPDEVLNLEDLPDM